MVQTIIASIALLFGLFFFIVGVVGIIRLPNVYSRLHASGKVATLGMFSLLIGGSFVIPSLMPRLLLLGLFFLVSGPTASHVIALSNRAGHNASPETAEEVPM